MGVRSSLRRRGPRAPALLGALVLLAAPGAACARDATNHFWSDFWRAEATVDRPGEPSDVPMSPRWFDALDVGAALHASSAPQVSAELTLRLRLDAADYLQRKRDEAEDFARLARVLEREARDREQLQRLAARCVGAWRAWQVRLIDLVAPGGAAAALPGLSAPDVAYLHGLRALLALDATLAAAADAVQAAVAAGDAADACRLGGVIDTLDLAADHPRLVAAALERSIAARTHAMLAAPAPPSAWLLADLRPGSTGGGGALRFGLDLPLPVTDSELDLALGGSGTLATARLSWHRSGAAARRPYHVPSAAPPPQPEALEGELRDALRRRTLESRLLLQAADRQWDEACGSGQAPRAGATDARSAGRAGGRSATIDCLAAGARDEAQLAALLVAVDAEIAALQAMLGAIAASGHALAALVPPPG
jgi:hypothetical protein